MIRYSIGIAEYIQTNDARNNNQIIVVTVRKNKPVWQYNKLNYVGGKIEEGETPEECIAREFEEEAGVKTTPDSWKYVGKMFRKNDFECFVFYQLNQDFINATTKTSEEIEHWDIDLFKTFVETEEIMPNLIWMLEYTHSLDFAEYNCTFINEYPEDDRNDLS